MGDPIVEKGLICGIIDYRVSSRYNRSRGFRILARIATDESFREEGQKPTDHQGTIRRYVEGGPGQWVTGSLTVKELLFGEYGRPGHKAHVTTFFRGDKVKVFYRELTQENVELLKKIMFAIGLDNLD